MSSGQLNDVLGVHKIGAGRTTELRFELKIRSYRMLGIVPFILLLDVLTEGKAGGTLSYLPK